MDMFKSRQKQDDTPAADTYNDNKTGVVTQKKNDEFDAEYLNRHTKYKQDHIINPEFDPETIVTGEDDLLVRLN